MQKYSVGTDLDPCAIDATYENMEVNGISKDKYEVMIGNIIDDKAVQDKVGYGCYDIVVANILADVLVPLTPVIVNQLKDGGIYVTSGIIEDKEETVKAAVEAKRSHGSGGSSSGRMGICNSEKRNESVGREDQKRCIIFFVTPQQISGDKIRIEGGDVNHMKNVLRMKLHEKAEISDGESRTYLVRGGSL